MKRRATDVHPKVAAGAVGAATVAAVLAVFGVHVSDGVAAAIAAAASFALGYLKSG